MNYIPTTSKYIKLLFTFYNHFDREFNVGLVKRVLKQSAHEIRGERLLRTHALIGQEVQLPSSVWTRAIE